MRKILVILLILLVLSQTAGACEKDDWSIKTNLEDTLLGGTCPDGYREAYTPNPDDGNAVYCEELPKG